MIGGIIAVSVIGEAVSDGFFRQKRNDSEREGCEKMTNLILFVNSFLSYLLLFVLIVALVIVACVIGVKWRKSKDAKAALETPADGSTTA